MLTLIKKELKMLFCSPTFLAIASTLSLIPVVLLAVFLKISQEQSAYAGFENIVSFMVLVFAAVIPAVTIISASRDKRAGAEEFTYSMPVSRSAIILSRLLSQVIFFAVPTALMAFIPLVLKGFGIVNFAHAYLALALLFAFEIFIISLSVMLAEKIGKLLISIVISYSVILVSLICGFLSALVRFLPFGTGFDSVASGALVDLSIFKKVDSAVYELFDWTALAFFVCGIVVFTVIAIVKVKRKMVTAIVSVLFVACVGILPMLLPLSARYIDINQNKLYTPSASMKKYLSGVDEDITVYLIDPYSNRQEFYNVIVRTVESCERANLKIVNSAEDKDFLQKYGLQNESQESLAYSLIIQGEERWKFINYLDYVCYYNKTMGYLTATEVAYRYETCANYLESTYEYYDLLSDEQKELYKKSAQIVQSILYETLECLQFENVFVDAIAYVTADMIPTVYFLEGHGEEGTTANPYNFKANPNLPKNADMVVINSPSEDYSESEINALKKYLDNGGKLYILTDVENYSMPNLMSLLTYYGLSVDANVISVDEKTAIPVSVNKSHKAFESISASEVTVKSVSKINCAEETKYTYSPMLSYTYTEGEGEDIKKTEYPVAISVSEGDEKKITLFTGATTFNTTNSDISEEELERVSPCVSAVMLWMFDEFEADTPTNTPKAYQKSFYVADDGQIAKAVVGFSVAIVVFTLALSAYILSRRLRSKRALREDE